MGGWYAPGESGYEWEYHRDLVEGRVRFERRVRGRRWEEQLRGKPVLGGNKVMDQSSCFL